ncbi:IK [Mytilus edulis]|uniref:IK n=1 Tax=Mytilus edulis TaxID=6550 RepID=A0A8S3QBQ1_MYTED|nr:IK [Mytilus edulis]
MVKILRQYLKFEAKTNLKTYTFQQIQPTIKWDKVDQDLYLAIINGQVDTIAESPAETAEDADLLISKMHQMLTKAATESSSKKSKYKAKPKLKVWTPIIKSSLKEMRKCYEVWSRNGKPTNPADKSYQDRVNTRKEFKKQVKVEQARERDREKQEILEARTRDSKLYHKLVKRQQE